MEAAGISQVQSLVEAAMAPAMTRQAVDVAILGKVLDVATAHNAALLEALPPLTPGVGGQLDMVV